MAAIDGRASRLAEQPVSAYSSLGHLLRRQAEEHPSREAIVALTVAGRRALTFEQLYDGASRAAHWLLSNGVRRGDRVALLLDTADVCDFFVMIDAGYVAGLVSVPINARLAPPEIRYQLEHSGASVLVTSGRFADVVASGAEDFGVRLVIDVGDPRAEWPVASVPLSTLVSSDERAEPRCGRDDLCDLLYSSGTTGHPKGALFTHGACLENGRIWTETMGYDASTSIMLASPMYTSTGTHSFPLPGLWSAATVIYEERFNAALWVQHVEQERPDFYLGVPSMYLLIAEYLDCEPAAEFSPPQGLMYGAASMPEPVLRRMMSLFPRADLWHLYGLTEAGPTGAVLHPSDALRKVGSVGTALVDSQLRIVDVDGNELAAGEEGEIALLTPARMSRYLDNDEATRGAIDDDGWLRTGDVGRLDDEGYLYILDRKNDVIFRGGFNIYPAEVEAALTAHPAVLEAAVVGVPHAVLGQAVQAFVVRRPGMHVDAVELQAFCEELIADYKRPRTIEFVTTLPKNAMGKLLRRELLTASRDTAAAAGTTR